MKVPGKVVQTETILFYARLGSNLVDYFELVHSAKSVEKAIFRLSLVSADFHASDIALHGPGLPRLTRHPDTDKLCMCLQYLIVGLCCIADEGWYVPVSL